MLSDEQNKEVADTLRGIADAIEAGRYRVEHFVLHNGLAQKPPQNGARCYVRTGEQSVTLTMRDTEIYV